MKKWKYWWMLFLISLVHGGIFLLSMLTLLFSGERQAGMTESEVRALILVPGLCLLAVLVLLAILLYTLLRGLSIRREATISLGELLTVRGLRGFGLIGRLLLFAALAPAALLGLMCLFRGGFDLAFYLLTGDLFLLFLYGWRRTAVRSARAARRARRLEGGQAG